MCRRPFRPARPTACPHPGSNSFPRPEGEPTALPGWGGHRWPGGEHKGRAQDPASKRTSSGVGHHMRSTWESKSSAWCWGWSRAGWGALLRGSAGACVWFSCLRSLPPGHRAPQLCTPPCLGLTHLPLPPHLAFPIFPFTLYFHLPFPLAHLHPCLPTAAAPPRLRHQHCSHRPTPASLWWAGAHSACPACPAERCCNWHLSHGGSSF